MELSQHIAGVQSRARGDWSEYETVWSFKISSELYAFLRVKIVSEVHRLYNKYTGNGTATGHCPSLGEYDEDFAWVFFGDQEFPLNLYESADGGYFEVILQNQPEDELDRLDPDHPHHTSAPPTQWAEALCAIKQITATF